MKKLNLKKQLVKLFTVLAIAGAFTLSAAAQTESKQKTAPELRRCSEHTIGGSYGHNITGTFFLPPAPGSTNPTPIPLASVGRMTFDGVGNVSGKDTNSFGGGVTRYPLNGTYTVERDCTGTLTLTLPDGFVITNDFIIVDGGKEIFLIQTNPGTVITGVLKQQ